MTNEKISEDTLERLVTYDKILDRIRRSEQPSSTSSIFLAKEQLYELFPKLQEYKRNKQK